MARDDATEAPTPKRLREARRRGDVPLSREVVATAGLAAAVGLVAVFGVAAALDLGAFLRAALRIAVTGDLDRAGPLLEAALARLLWTVGPVVIGAGLLGTLAAYAQVGALFSLEPVQLKLERLDPAEGLKRLLSPQTLSEAARALVKAVLVGWVAYAAIRDHLGVMVAEGVATEARLRGLGAAALGLALRVLVVLALLAALDALLRRRAHLRRLRMTREEVKREHREEEGDPRHKAERRRRHKRLLEEAALRTVPRADVVLVNPAHVAVALRYDKASMSAPVVTAKGQRRRAARIRELARAHGVPIERDPPLARALYELELDEAIPEALYDAVAEVLRVVYERRAARERA